jgi:hypothetical protein
LAIAIARSMYKNYLSVGNFKIKNIERHYIVSYEIRK